VLRLDNDFVSLAICRSAAERGKGCDNDLEFTLKAKHWNPIFPLLENRRHFLAQVVFQQIRLREIQLVGGLAALKQNQSNCYAATEL
jgi:hypothetical protein